MITGYNTDVRHNDVVFHVQTEDKGAANPSIESLVYVGGQVLASKRASYAELVAQGKDDKAVIALMDHQHRTMIAAIRHGKFDEKLLSLNAARQTGRSTGAHPSLVTPPAPVAPAPAPAATVAPADPQATLAPSLPPLPPLPPMSPMSPIPSVAPALPPPPAPVAPPPPAAARPQGSLLAAAKVAERSLDQVILEYLTSEADQDQLLLMLEGEPQLILGQPAAVALRASSSKSGLPISGAQVSIKMISTVSEPRMLAAGRTDDEGTLQLLFDVPQLTRGTAALIITAVAAIGRAELKQLL
ncbi:MAG: hypothetical protein QOJ16_855 [Acidobacteriota bacterium]|nr:hypothetical protein [Acidobacteriota bacterium]